MEVIYGDDNKKIMLKDNQLGNIKLLGIREWTILKGFAENKLEQIAQSFQKEFIEKVISKGIEMNILVEKPNTEATPTNNGFVRNIHNKITQYDLGMIKLDLHGSFNLFKLFRLSLPPNNIFERINFKAVFLLWSILLFVLSGVVYINQNQYNFIFFEVVKYVSTPIPLLIIGSFFTSFFFTIIHELGHFIIYKALGGKNNAIGVGTKFFVIPIFYVNTDTTYLWTEKWKRILVILGGILADIIVILAIGAFIALGYKHYPQASFFSFLLLISLTIKMFFNVNFFITGNDGYFLFSEIINQTNLAKSLQQQKMYFLSEVKKGGFFKIPIYTWLSLVFLTISFVFKALSMFMMIWSFWYIYKISI